MFSNFRPREAALLFVLPGASVLLNSARGTPLPRGWWEITVMNNSCRRGRKQDWAERDLELKCCCTRPMGWTWDILYRLQEFFLETIGQYYSGLRSRMPSRGGWNLGQDAFLPKSKWWLGPQVWVDSGQYPSYWGKLNPVSRKNWESSHTGYDSVQYLFFLIEIQSLLEAQNNRWHIQTQRYVRH